MQRIEVLQKGWPLVQKKTNWSVGYLMCLVPVTLIQTAMKALKRK